MGYNGSNRRGAPRSMWKTSSNKAGNNMLFGKRGFVTGLFDIGNSKAKDVQNSISNGEHSDSTNDVGNSTVIAAMMIVGFIIALVCISLEISVLGFVIIICITFALVLYLVDLDMKKNECDIKDQETFKRIKIKISPLKEIDAEFTKKLLANFALECYFHFRRPLLSQEEYDKTTFSLTFKKAFYLYEGYKSQWKSTFHHYTFEMKVHQMLIQLLNEDYIDTKDNEYLEEQFYMKMRKRLVFNLNQDEIEYYRIVQRNGCTMKSFINWYGYKTIWMVNKYEPEKIRIKLNEDLLYRQKSCINNVLVWHGGLELWNGSIPQIVEDYENGMLSSK